MSTRRFILAALALILVAVLGSVIAGSWWVGPSVVTFPLAAILLGTYMSNR